MDFKIDLQLNSLRVVQPDETEEEPYLWTFFFTLDGSTVKQVQPNALQLLGTVKISGGYGGHANLSSSQATSGQVLQIPDSVGAHQTTLRPIRLTILGENVVIPGRVLAFCVLMEEDATSDGAILKANAALRDFLETQWNDFINTKLNEAAVLAESANVREANPGLAGRDLMIASIGSLIGKFVDSLEDPAASVVEDAVIEDSDIFELLDNFFDSDNSMGSQRVSFDEQQIIDAGLQIPIHFPIIRKEDGTWTAYHEVNGHLQASLVATSGDLVVETTAGSVTRMDGGEHVFDRGFLCIPAGTRVEWTLNGTALEFDIRSVYPFLNVRWSIENVPLNGFSGTASFTVDSAVPKFTPTQPPRLLMSQHGSKQVKVKWQIENNGDDGRRLQMFNDPSDGNYSFIVQAVGLAGNGVEVPLGSTMVTFSGQKIELGPADFLSSYSECLVRLGGIGERFAISKRLTKKDLWEPHARFALHDEMVQAVDEIAAARGVGEAQVTKLKKAIGSKLKVR